ncbi:MAG: hypothetical protein AAB250_05315, partial [Bdellovibrionota bacterium]
NKFMISALVLGLTATAQAHDEGHGPKTSDTGKYGGVVSAVVAKADASKGAKAMATNKAELVRGSDGTVRLYVYDTTMKPADLKGFDVKAAGMVVSGSKKKMAKSDFALEQKDGAFVGTLPKELKAPYSVEVTLKQTDKELLAAFQNLD